MTKEETIVKLTSLLVRCQPYVIVFYDPTKFSASMSGKNAHQLAHEIKCAVHLLEGELVEAHNEIVERLERNRDAALERAQAAIVHAEMNSVQRGYVYDIIAALKGEEEEDERTEERSQIVSWLRFIAYEAEDDEHFELAYRTRELADSIEKCEHKEERIVLEKN